MSNASLSNLLQELKLEKYLNNFADYGVEKMDDLFQLEQEDWRALDIQPFHRKKILLKVSELTGIPVELSDEETPNSLAINLDNSLYLQLSPFADVKLNSSNNNNISNSADSNDSSISTPPQTQSTPTSIIQNKDNIAVPVNRSNSAAKVVLPTSPEKDDPSELNKPKQPSRPAPVPILSNSSNSNSINNNNNSNNNNNNIDPCANNGIPTKISSTTTSSSKLSPPPLQVQQLENEENEEIAPLQARPATPIKTFVRGGVPKTTRSIYIGDHGDAAKFDGISTAPSSATEAPVNPFLATRLPITPASAPTRTPPNPFEEQIGNSSDEFSPKSGLKSPKPLPQPKAKRPPPNQPSEQRSLEGSSGNSEEEAELTIHRPRRRVGASRDNTINESQTERNTERSISDRTLQTTAEKDTGDSDGEDIMSVVSPRLLKFSRDIDRPRKMKSPHPPAVKLIIPEKPNLSELSVNMRKPGIPLNIVPARYPGNNSSPAYIGRKMLALPAAPTPAPVEEPMLAQSRPPTNRQWTDDAKSARGAPRTEKNSTIGFRPKTPSPDAQNSTKTAPKLAGSGNVPTSTTTITNTSTNTNTNTTTTIKTNTVPNSTFSNTNTITITNTNTNTNNNNNNTNTNTITNTITNSNTIITSSSPLQPDSNEVNKGIGWATALFDNDDGEADELYFKTGDKIKILKQFDSGWWFGELRGKTGLFPANYVEVCSEAIATKDG